MMLAAARPREARHGYQRDAPQREVRFPPGTTWLCFSDQVTHAVMRAST